MIEAGTSWGLALLLLRIVAVGVLYLFLYSAFRALRGELRGELRDELPAAAPAPADTAYRGRLDAPEPDAAHLEESVAWPGTRPLPPPTPSRRIPARIAIPAAAAVVVMVLGSVAALAFQEPPGDTATELPATSTSEPFGPPTATPAAGRVTVGLAAQEDSQVRITVDGVVQFDGTLRARQRQSWEAGERIQVWTDKGKTLLLAVNGVDLGPYSPAMGHPDWNRIDFGFWPGWAQ